jgi:hypothetical protein
MGINRKVKGVFLLLIVFCLATATAWSQNTYRYKADLQKIDSSGVYKIKLGPGLVAKCNEKLSDIRLVDQNGKFAAYALSKNVFIDNPEHFIEFPEVKSDAGSDTAVVYIAENKAGLKINLLGIRLKNTDVRRSLILSGSGDLKKWFAIKEDIPLEAAGSGNKTDYDQLLSIPSSNYQYFKIQVNCKNKAPVKIIRIGTYVNELTGDEFALIPPVKFNSKDTNKISHVYIHFDEPYLINKLNMVVSAPNYYERQISICNNESGQKLCDTTIDFRGHDIYLSAKTSQLRIDISNSDDVPLTIKSIQAFQQEQYLISYLEAGHNYSVLSGDPSPKQAIYDLSFLKYKSYNRLPVVSHSAVYKNPIYVAPKPVAKNNFTLLLWIAIIAVLILLSFLTWRMVREINLKQTE